MLKGLLARKLRLALTALSITLGVAFVAGTFVLTDTISYAFDRLFEDVTRRIDLSVRPETAFAGVGNPVPEDLVSEIREVDGVAAAGGTVAGYAQLVDPSGQVIETGGAPPLGISWSDESQTSPLVIRKGHPPRTGREVVVDAATVKANDFALGDEITVLFQGPPRRFEIVGIAGFGAAEGLGGATIAAFDVATAQRVLGVDGYTAINVTTEAGASARRVQNAIKTILPDEYEVVRGTDIAEESADQVKEGLGFFQNIMLVFGGIALFVGAFIIFNTFSITLAQRAREMAMLRTLGATQSQIMAYVLAESAAVGLVASVVGVVLGVAGATALPAILEGFGIDIPDAGTQIVPRTVGVSLLIGTTIAVVSALLPAHRAGSVPPLAALRDFAPAATRSSRGRNIAGLAITGGGAGTLAAGLMLSGGLLPAVGAGAAIVLIGAAILSPVLAGPLARIAGWPLIRLRGVSGRLARDNAIRNPQRTAATAAALMIGLAMVSLAAIFAASLKATTTDLINGTLRSDFALTTSQFASFSPEVAERLRATDELGVVSPVRYGAFGLDGEDRFLVAVDPDTVQDVLAVNPISGDIGNLTKGHILLSSDVAREQNVLPGDSLSVEFARTGLTQLTVGGVVEDNVLVGDYIVSIATYERNFVEKLDGIVYVKIAPGVGATEARGAINDATRDWPNLRVQDQTEVKEQYISEIDQLLGLVYALLGLAILIALLGIVNTLALSVFERTREIGLLRAVGMTPRQVRSAVRWEAVIVAILGALFGIAVGTSFGWALVSTLEDLTRLVFPVGQLVLFVVLAAIAGVIAGAPAARRAARVDILKAVTVE